MAGLFNPGPEQQAMPAQGGLPAETGQPPGGPMLETGQLAPLSDAEGGENVSPEEQQQYDDFVGNAMSMIYDESMEETILQSLQGAGNPIDGLGHTVSIVVMAVEDSAIENGIELSGDVIFHGALEITEQLAEFSETAGIHTFSEEDIESAFYIGVDTYRSTRTEEGRIDSESLTEDMNQLMMEEQQGTIDQTLPGITEYANRRGNQAQQGGALPPEGRA